MMRSNLLVERRAPTDPPPAAPPGRASGGLFGRLNRLRATVLGANDGLVSEAGLMIGMAGATTQRAPLLTVGVAGLAAGAVSMALGEYVSVSSQRDAERHQLALEHRCLLEDPAGEPAEPARIYRAKGLSATTADQAAAELTATDALAAHAEAELRIDPADLANPWQAAGASAVAFVAGALVPLAAITLPPPRLRVGVAVVVLIGLACAGWLGARVGGGRCGRAVLRVLIGGATGLAVTYWVGHLAGATVAGPAARSELSPTGARLQAATDPDTRRATPPPARPAGPAELRLHHLALGTAGRHRLACRASRLERCTRPAHRRPKAPRAPSPSDGSGSYVKWIPA